MSAFDPKRTSHELTFTSVENRVGCTENEGLPYRSGSRLNLEVPDGWQLVAYLCVGYPDEEHLDPELDRHGWQERANVGGFVIER